MIDFSTIKALTIPEGDVKRIDINGVKVWELDVRNPYQRVEYIRTSGGSNGGYFLTDFKMNNNCGMELTFSVENFQDIKTMGSVAGSSNTRCYVFNPTTTSKGFVGWNGYLTLNIAITANAPYTSQLNLLNNRKHILLDANSNSLVTNSLSATLTQQTKPVSILRYDGERGRPMSIYSARISDGNEVVREYFPCYRKEDGAIGLFDICTKTFLENQGGDTLSIGAGINW